MINYSDSANIILERIYKYKYKLKYILFLLQ